MAAAIAPGPSRRAAAARAAEQRGRSRVGLLTAAGVILVVLIGAGTALYLRSSERRLHPIRRRSSLPTKARCASSRPRIRLRRTVRRWATPSTIALPALRPKRKSRSSRARRSLKRSRASFFLRRRRPTSRQRPPARMRLADRQRLRNLPSLRRRSHRRRNRSAQGSDLRRSRRRQHCRNKRSSPAAPNPAAAQNEQLTSETEPIEPTPVPTVAIAEASADGRRPTAARASGRNRSACRGRHDPASVDRRSSRPKWRRRNR